MLEVVRGRGWRNKCLWKGLESMRVMNIVLIYRFPVVRFCAICIGFCRVNRVQIIVWMTMHISRSLFISNTLVF
jgi:hypothetical protein